MKKHAPYVIFVARVPKCRTCDKFCCKDEHDRWVHGESPHPYEPRRVASP